MARGELSKHKIKKENISILRLLFWQQIERFAVVFHVSFPFFSYSIIFFAISEIKNTVHKHTCEQTLNKLIYCDIYTSEMLFFFISFESFYILWTINVTLLCHQFGST